MQLLVNVSMQRNWGVKPYPEAPGLPEHRHDEEVVQPEPARMQGVEMVGRAKREFLGELRRRQAANEPTAIDPDVLEQALAAI